MPSGFELVVSGGTKPVGKDAIAWAKQCQDLGAGVILPTSMDGDGTKAGYDLEFTKAIADAVTLPVVASGGAGTLEHFYEAVVQGGADILLAASVFHYRILSIRQVKGHLELFLVGREIHLQIRVVRIHRELEPMAGLR